jgi:hypothetical protein
MAIKSEKIVGKQIINEIESSNLMKTVYDLDKKTLVQHLKMVLSMNMLRYLTRLIQNSEWQNLKVNFSIPRYLRSTNTKK